MNPPPFEPGLKIAAQMSPEPSEDDLKFVKQFVLKFTFAHDHGLTLRPIRIIL
jgi:hypothetical protein